MHAIILDNRVPANIDLPAATAETLRNHAAAVMAAFWAILDRPARIRPPRKRKPLTHAERLAAAAATAHAQRWLMASGRYR